MICIYANCVHTRRLQSVANAICSCAINAWLITGVTCQMISRNYIVLFLTFRHSEKLRILNNFTSDVFIVHVLLILLRLQFGALGGLGRGFGVKHQIVQHCGALEWYIKTKILAVVTKNPNSPLQ